MINQFTVERCRDQEFLEFDKVYKNTKIIRLEDNYRSTQNILSVASHLISYNENRLGKN